MPRYEFSEGTSNKFWEIVLSGNSYTTTYGKIGTDGKSTTKDFANNTKAESEYNKAIAAKVKKGYVMVDGSEAEEPSDPNEPTTPAVTLDPAQEARFIDALKRDPNDIEAYLAYASWLQQAGHPRGNLIATQHKLLMDPQNKALRKAQDKLFEDHKDEFFGPFHHDRVHDMVEVSWYMGFIKTVRFRTTLEHDAFDLGSDHEDVVDLEELFVAFLDHPSVAFLQDLTLGIMDFEENSYDSATRILAERQLPTLRTLFMGDFTYEETELNWSTASSAGIYDSMPNLRSLTLRSNNLTFGDIRAPELREFDTISSGLEESGIRDIMNAYWPKLEQMSLSFGMDGIGTYQLPLLQPLLDAQGLPKLRRLGIINASFTPEFMPLLATSRLLPQLEELDFQYGVFGESCVQTIVDNKDAFAHIKLINVDECILKEEDINKLRSIFPEVHSQGQRDGEEEDRYPGMYE